MSPRKFAVAALLTLSGGVSFAQSPMPITNNAGERIIVVGENQSSAPVVTSQAPVQGCGPGGCQNGYAGGAPCITMNSCCEESCAPCRYAAVEYLLYFQKDAPVNFPVATGSTQAAQGVLGVPTTTVLLGNSNIDNGNYAGLRLTIGGALNKCGTVFIEGSGFLLESTTNQQTIVGGPNQVLARPFIDANIGQENSRLLTSPDSFTGAITLSTANRVWGAEVNALMRAKTTCDSAIDYLAGFRFMSLEESVDIFDQSTSLANGFTSFNAFGIPGPGITTSVFDRIATTNRFYGGTVGGRYRYRSGKFEVGATGKVSVGVVDQTVAYAGTSTISGLLPEPMTVTGGLLSVASNLGRTSNAVFGILPEAQFKLSYHCSDSISIFGGYNFMWLSTAVRPGDNADRTINPTLVPTSPNFAVPFGPARPQPQFNDTDWWAHGASFGVAISF